MSILVPTYTARNVPRHPETSLASLRPDRIYKMTTIVVPSGFEFCENRYNDGRSLFDLLKKLAEYLALW